MKPLSRLIMGSHEKLLRDSCADANGVVYEYSRFDANYNGMGTTLIGGIITRRKACLVNVGDSRAYYLSRDEIRQISRDHSYVEALVAMGAIATWSAIRKYTITSGKTRCRRMSAPSSWSLRLRAERETMFLLF